MSFKETIITTPGGVFKKGYIEVPEAKSGAKYEKRKRINDEVFDLHDSVADNAKWSSVLTTFISRIYSILPEEQKALLDPSERALFEYALDEFSKTDTRMDVALQTEGIAVVDRLLTRQKKVGEIVD